MEECLMLSVQEGQHTKCVVVVTLVNYVNYFIYVNYVTIKEQRLKYYGHVKRHDCLERTISERMVDGSRGGECSRRLITMITMRTWKRRLPRTHCVPEERG